jgi:hypothetical protein
VKNEQNHEVGVNVRHSQNSWESKDSIDEGARSGLGGSSMPVDEGESRETKKESRPIQVEVNEMEQEKIVEV